MGLAVDFSLRVVLVVLTDRGDVSEVVTEDWAIGLVMVYRLKKPAVRDARWRGWDHDGNDDGHCIIFDRCGNPSVLVSRD